MGSSKSTRLTRSRTWELSREDEATIGVALANYLSYAREEYNRAEGVDHASGMKYWEERVHQIIETRGRWVSR